MTTDQMIDGVPRKLLTSLLAWLERANERNGDGDISEYVELRALLDAPACKRCNGSGWIDNLRPVGTQAMDCPDCKPAAQIANAQRRAADYKEQKAFNDWAWNKEGEAIGRMDGQAAAIEAWFARAKLAEQPDPVVSNPQCQSCQGRGSLKDADGMDKGYCGPCDGSGKALGSVFTPNRMDVPSADCPAHANPPPGTEPCGTHPHNDGLDEMRKPR